MCDVTAKQQEDGCLHARCFRMALYKHPVGQQCSISSSRSSTKSSSKGSNDGDADEILQFASQLRMLSEEEDVPKVTQLAGGIPRATTEVRSLAVSCLRVFSSTTAGAV